MIANAPGVFSVYSTADLRKQCDAIIKQKRSKNPQNHGRIAFSVDSASGDVYALELGQFEIESEKLDKKFGVPRTGSHSSNLGSVYTTDDGECYKIVFHAWRSNQASPVNSDVFFRNCLLLGMVFGNFNMNAEQVYAVATPLRGTDAVSKWKKKCETECAAPDCSAVGVLTKCSWCRTTYYCSDGCHRKHWYDKHAKECSREFKLKSATAASDTPLD